VLVRAYRAEDLDDLIAVFTGSVRIVARRDYSEAQVMAWAPDQPDRQRWAERCGSRPTWVAEIEGVIVGFSDLEPDGYLDRMYVHHAYQGRGVASALLDRVQAAAKAQGLDRLFTEASITARPFFERRGFVVLAPQTVEVRGQRFTNFRMEKQPL
jgi:putative acetyltransferase